MPILAAGSQAASWGIMVLYVVLIIGFMYFLAIKPQKKQEKKQKEVMAALGNYAQYKGKEEDTFVAAVQVDETPEFYGWLTGMGKDVILMKRKKSVQAYRDYLKGILKEYK